jgi:hypothetical protein
MVNGEKRGRQLGAGVVKRDSGVRKGLVSLTTPSLTVGLLPRQIAFRGSSLKKLAYEALVIFVLDSSEQCVAELLDRFWRIKGETLRTSGHR